MADEHVPEENQDIRFEVADASIRQVVLAGVGLAAATVIACFAMYFLFNMLKQSGGPAQAVNPMAPPRTLPPEPRLEERPWMQHQTQLTKEDQILDTYGWTNKNAGLVRIPIDKAMDIVVQRGLPTRTPGQPAKTEPASAAVGRAGQPQAVPRSSATPGAPVLKESGNAQRK
jgi:hypothetical protein